MWAGSSSSCRRRAGDTDVAAARLERRGRRRAEPTRREVALGRRRTSLPGCWLTGLPTAVLLAELLPLSRIEAAVGLVVLPQPLPLLRRLCRKTLGHLRGRPLAARDHARLVSCRRLRDGARAARRRPPVARPARQLHRDDRNGRRRESQRRNPKAGPPAARHAALLFGR